MLPKVFAVGNVGRDATLKYTAQGTAKGDFSIACSEKYKGEEKTEWLNCVMWGKQAEGLTEFITKGKQLVVTGKLQTQQWTDDQGQKHSRTELIVQDVQFVGGNPTPRQRPQNGDEFDDLPFE